jgi:hypothetical protein
MQKVERVLRWWDKKTEELVGEIPLTAFTLAELQQIFGVPRSDPMYDVFDVNEAHAKRLQSRIEHTIDCSAYDYSVHSYVD